MCLLFGQLLLENRSTLIQNLVTLDSVSWNSLRLLLSLFFLSSFLHDERWRKKKKKKNATCVNENETVVVVLEHSLTQPRIHEIETSRYFTSNNNHRFSSHDKMSLFYDIKVSWFNNDSNYVSESTIIFTMQNDLIWKMHRLQK